MVEGAGPARTKLGMRTRANHGGMADIEKKTKRYATDLTDEEREGIMPFLPSPARRCGKPVVDLREALNAVGPITSTHGRAIEQAGFEKAASEWEVVVDKLDDAKLRTLGTKPTSRLGAIALLRFIADDLGRFFGLEAEVGGGDPQQRCGVGNGGVTSALLRRAREAV